MCKFSIIIPCYNSRDRVDVLFKMYSLTDYKDYEVLFIDDCSNDNTFEEMRKKKKEYNNYRIYKTQKNEGPGPARNFGLKMAQGEYLLFCDSDDEFDISCLYEIDAFLKMHDDLDMIVFPHSVVRRKKTSKVDTFSKRSDGERITAHDIVNGYGGPVAKLYKNSIIKEKGIVFPQRMQGEDFCFVVSYAIHVKKAYKMNLDFYKYIMNTSSITHTYKMDLNTPTTFELLNPIYRKYFPEIEIRRFIEGHLLTRAKQMVDAKCSIEEIKEWFRIQNQRYPNWIQYTTYMDQSIYRKMIYKAMYYNKAWLIKLIMNIRKVLY